MGMMSEFKEFAMKGNVVDMAVGLVIGAAFGKVVTSVVNDVIMPPVGVLIGGVDFSELSLTIQEATADAAAVTINWGSTVQTIINFTIIAFAIFMVVKGMNKMKKKEEEAPEAPAEPSKEEVLLTEIRDALLNKK
ncbi:Large-conductance mechanosensitive channel [hydrothermal vent metagenome]|uniref:Large-conductance mechanosensitive channel n=1 Tax=hydrothermal vent metagenome TaxID=652676 RepID=A0A3B0VU11_9ZZZZ